MILSLWFFAWKRSSFLAVSYSDSLVPMSLFLSARFLMDCGCSASSGRRPRILSSFSSVSRVLSHHDLHFLGSNHLNQLSSNVSPMLASSVNLLRYALLIWSILVTPDIHRSTHTLFIWSRRTYSLVIFQVSNRSVNVAFELQWHSPIVKIPLAFFQFANPLSMPALILLLMSFIVT